MRKLIGITLIIYNCFNYSDVKANQHTTIHSYKTTLEIISPSKAKATYFKKWTIYNNHNSEDGRVVIAHDPNFKIKELSLKISKEGQIFSELLQKDFSDYSISQGFEINDARALVYSYSYNEFPVTMELEYTINIDGLIYFPDWAPLTETEMILEQASFVLSFPHDYKIGIKEINLNQPKIDKDDKNHIYQWEIDSTIGPWINEVYAPPLSEKTPRLMLRPGEFQFENSSGYMETWKGLGKWATELARGRTQLDSDTREFLQKEFGNLETEEEKVKKVYEWVQSRCRYVSVQLGIGGWQPQSAIDVNKKGYGDCKGLSNFTKAALSELGIKADYCLVYANPYYDKCNPDFPAIQSFNHAILRVALPEDTLWLECTSSKTPYNGITPSIAGKYTLIVEGDQSKLVKIPLERSKLEVVRNKMKISLNEEGSANVHGTILYSGLLFYDLLYAEDLNTKDQRILFDENINGTSYELRNLTYQNKTQQKQIECSVDLDMNMVWRQLGDEIFYKPFNFKNELPELPANPKRYNDLLFHRSFDIADTGLIQLPAGYSVNYLPDDTILQSNFGKSKIFYIIEDKNLKMISAINIPAARYTASEYEAARKFLLETRMLMDRKIILKKAQ